jgi:hypothetical protein
MERACEKSKALHQSHRNASHIVTAAVELEVNRTRKICQETCHTLPACSLEIDRQKGFNRLLRRFGEKFGVCATRR